MRRQSNLLMQIFVIPQIDFHTDDLSRGAACIGFPQCFATDKIFFLQVHRPAEADFKRRIFLCRNQGFFRADIVHFQQDKPRLKTRNVKREHTRGFDSQSPSFFHQHVPDSLSVLGTKPKLVAKIAGVSRARHKERYRSEDGGGQPKKF